MWRGAYEWDPARIVAQIVAIQALFYAVLTCLLFVLVGEGGGGGVRSVVAAGGAGRASATGARGGRGPGGCRWALTGDVMNATIAASQARALPNHLSSPPFSPSGPYAADGLSCAHVFAASSLDVSSFAGWMVAVGNLLTAVVMAPGVAAVVRRARKCLDFAATLYFIHFVTCAWVGGFPQSAAWWLVNGACFAAVAVGSEWVALQREMADIPLGAAIRRAAAAAAGAVGGGGGGGDKEGAGGVELGRGGARAASTGGLPV